MYSFDDKATTLFVPISRHLLKFVTRRPLRVCIANQLGLTK